MPTGFSFEVQGVTKLLSLFDQLPEKVQTELSNELKVTASEITSGAKRDAPADEARLKSAISFKETGKTSFEVVAQTFYAGYLEFGTKAQTVIPAGLEGIASQLKGASGQEKGDPLKAITAWVKRKGIAGTFSVKTKKLSRSKASLDNIKTVAFMIWRKIKKFGIKAHPYFFKQLPEAEKNLKERVANIIKRII